MDTACRDDIFAELEHLASTIVPSGRLVDRLESGERRNVTILFLQVGGDVEKVKLQQINEKLLPVFDRVVQKHGGYVDKHFADGLMALFGAKKATGRDASVAVACALEVQSRMKAANEVLSQAGIELGVRTGINTGEVAVGGVGAEREEDFTAYGDAVNTAKRFETACPYGEIYIGDSSRELAGTAFEYVDAGELELKGKAEPVRAWKVKGRSSKVTRRWERKAPVKLGRTFAGRKEELAAFEEIVAKARSRVDNERVPRMTPGAPKALVAAVRGEAGIGKSRLIEQFVKGNGKRSALSVMEHRGEAVRTAGAPYQVLSSAICHFAGTAPLAADSPAKVTEALATLKEESAGNPEGDSLVENLDRVRYLSGDSSAATSVEGLDASALQTALMIAFRSFLEASAVARQAKGAVAVFIADDVQWADKASLAIIEGVLDSLAGHLSIFAIVMSRPEWEVPEEWRKSQELKELELKPLPEDAADVQLEGLLGEDADIPEDERRWLFACAQGNPFYLEELVLGAIRAGAIGHEDGSWKAITPLEEVGLPPTLDELILGHIDSVGDKLRTLLQRAAVVGQPFWSNIVSHIYKALKERGEISPRLVSLIDMDLIYSETEMAGDAGVVELPYFFRHVLLKDGAYKMLLKMNRRVLHRLAAAAIEEIHAADLVPFYDPLAYHWEEAGYPFEAAGYLLEAFKVKGRSQSAETRFSRASRGLALLESCKDRADFAERRDEVAALRIEYLLLRGTALEIQSRVDEARKDFEEVLGSPTDDRIEVRALKGLALLDRGRSDYESAMKRCEDGLAIAKRIEDRSGMIMHLSLAGSTYISQGDYVAATESIEEALELARLEGDKALIADMCNNLGIALSSSGEYKREMELYKESLALAREIDDKLGIAVSIARMGLVYKWLGDYELAVQYTTEGLELFREMGDKFSYQVALGQLAGHYYLLRDYEKTLRFSEENVAFYRSIGNERATAYALANLGYVIYAMGDYPTALKHFEESLAIRRKIGDRAGIGSSMNRLGMTYKSIGDYKTAYKHHKEALKIARDLKDRPLILESVKGLASVQFLTHDYPAALLNFEEMFELAGQTGNKDALRKNIDICRTGVEEAAEKAIEDGVGPFTKDQEAVLVGIKALLDAVEEKFLGKDARTWADE